MKTYKHYGNTEFIPELFSPPINYKENPWVKPICGTGFWASPLREDGETEWFDFIHDNPEIGYSKDMGKSFLFTVKENANIITIAEPKDFLQIEKFILNEGRYKERAMQSINHPEEMLIQENIYLDFEAMSASGIDALELDMRENFYYLHYMLYDWDVSSILIMNKDIIVPL